MLKKGFTRVISDFFPRKPRKDLGGRKRTLDSKTIYMEENKAVTTAFTRKTSLSFYAVKIKNQEP